MSGLHTFSNLVATQSFLAVGELDDVQDFSLCQLEIILIWLLYDTIRIHHHGVQHPERPLVLGNDSLSGQFLAFSVTVTCLV